MKRKVALIGPSTLMVSLPAKWAKENRIKKGDELDVQAREKELVLSIEPNLPEAKILHLAQKDVGKFEKNTLAYIYHKGYDEARITFEDEESRREILKKLGELVGFEIVSQSEKSIVIKSISEPKAGEFDAMLRRTFLVLLEMAESCHAAFDKGSQEELGETALLESMNNKYTDFLKRSINRNGYPKPENTSFIYAIVRDLEHLADSYRALCMSYLLGGSRRMGREPLSLLNKTNSQLREYYSLFYKFSKDKAIDYHSNSKELSRLTVTAFKKSGKEELMFFHYLMEIQATLKELFGPYYSMQI